jgi:ABC-type sugar transport system ATPase subunit
MMGDPTPAAARPESTTGPVLELRGISKRFGHVQALIDADFALSPGEIMALVGDNGAGKSTLIKVIAGAHQPDSGEIRIDGHKVDLPNPRAATAIGIATVYQDLALVDQRSIAANLFLGREPTRGITVDHRRMAAEAEATLAKLRIRIPSVHTLVGNLSGGQRQAVAIGRAMAQNSRIVILDEPTAALGVEQQQFVLELVMQLKAAGHAIVLISHNLIHVFAVADRISVMRGGRRVGVRRKSETSNEEIIGMIVGARLH